MTVRLRRISPDQIAAALRDPVDADTIDAARQIVDDVQRGGATALRAHAERLGDLEPGAPMVIGREALTAALEALPEADRALLRRTAARIDRFAAAQKACLHDLDLAIEGGRAGHRFAPVERAGCYAPGGRFPLPSSVLMTAVTARRAGVGEVWVASPKPTAMTLAAAAAAGADALLAVGGAQAIAALAFGAGPVPRCDALVGPGNRWVTAAKQIVAGRVAIDMLAGPSELTVLADATADPEVVAADLLAQAEHDPDARVTLVTVDAAFADSVEAALDRQLVDLSTAEIAAASLAHGLIVLAPDLDAAITACDTLAPEHLELQIEGAAQVATRLAHYGALFIGAGAAEVLGDYGAGPNHVLPTSGSARFTGGLSVLGFLRLRTQMQLERPGAQLLHDAAALARHEGLEAHARAADIRRCSAPEPQGASPITFADVLDAEARIRPYVSPTPLRTYATLDAEVGHRISVFVKHENHNPTNAFKARNGMSALTALDAAAAAGGVVAATRGNHGQAVAWAGRRLGIEVTICVPVGNNPEKNDAMRGYGATVIEEGRDYDESVTVMNRLVAERGLTPIHSTNDPNVVAGAATYSLEILQQAPDLDALVIAVGGGSQAVGALTVVEALKPAIEVFGVQAANAPAIHDAWHAGELRSTETADTFADGLATRQPYPGTFPALQAGLTDFITVTEAELAEAVRQALRTTHNLVEGAGAAGLAGLMRLRQRLAGKKVGIVLSGGNIDADTLRRIMSGDLS